MVLNETPMHEPAERVTVNTAEEINERIRRQTEANLCYFAEHPEEIDRRLGELDREWDIERLLEANAASVMLLGLALGVTSSHRWLAVPVGAAGFLLQHAMQGWCPPLPVFRRLGVRTTREIEQERYALKYLRGDFSAAMGGDLSGRERAGRALAAVRARGG